MVLGAAVPWVGRPQGASGVAHAHTQWVPHCVRCSAVVYSRLGPLAQLVGEESLHLPGCSGVQALVHNVQAMHYGVGPCCQWRQDQDGELFEPLWPIHGQRPEETLGKGLQGSVLLDGVGIAVGLSVGWVFLEANVIEQDGDAPRRRVPIEARSLSEVEVRVDGLLREEYMHHELVTIPVGVKTRVEGEYIELEANATRIGTHMQDGRDGQHGVRDWEEMPDAGEDWDDALYLAGLFPDHQSNLSGEPCEDGELSCRVVYWDLHC